MIQIPYGTDGVLYVPVASQAAPLTFKTTPTLAAGDIKIRNKSQAFTNLVAVAAAFTSGGTAEPVPGETLTGATSGKTAIYIDNFLTGGSWAGGDAAGTIFVKSPNGAFGAGENVNGSVSGANVLTVTADFVAQPTALADAGGGVLAIPYTAAESTTKKLLVLLADAAGAEWCSDFVEVETTDHPSAGDPAGCILYDAVGTATGQTTTNIRLSGAATITPLPGMFGRVVSGTGIHQAFRVKAYLTAGGHYDLTPYDALTTALDATSVIKVYESETLVPSNAIEVNGTAQTAGDIPALVVTADAAVDALATTVGVAGAGLTSTAIAGIGAAGAGLTAVLANNTVETGLTAKAALQLLAAIILGKVTLAASAAPVFTSADVVGGVINGAKNRVTGGTVDADGNRDAATVDLT